MTYFPLNDVCLRCRRLLSPLDTYSPPECTQENCPYQPESVLQGPSINTNSSTSSLLEPCVSLPMTAYNSYLPHLQSSPHLAPKELPTPKPIVFGPLSSGPMKLMSISSSDTSYSLLNRTT